MPRTLFILLLLLPLFSKAQTDPMLVYTVAGGTLSGPLGDGGPATAAYIDLTEGVWLDGAGNIYISDLLNQRIRKVNAATGVITTIAGNGSVGFSGDNGLAVNAEINGPYGLYAAANGDVYFADLNNERVRKVNAATGIITTIAGGGSSLGDGGPATNASLYAPASVYIDKSGNIYVGENYRIRKISPAGVISTIAGNGTTGLSGDGGPATNAQLWEASGIVEDNSGNIFFADRANSRIRKIDKTGIITTVAGTTYGYSGDNGPATNAQIYGPIGLGIDNSGNLIIADNGNNYIRKVNMATGIMTTIAGVGNDATKGSTTEGAPATTTFMHPEFLYVDNKSGAIYFSTWGINVRKIINYEKAESNAVASPVSVDEQQEVAIYPNPSKDIIVVKVSNGRFNNFEIFSSLGQVVLQGTLTSSVTNIDIRSLGAGSYLAKFFNNNQGFKTFKFMKY